MHLYLARRTSPLQDEERRSGGKAISGELLETASRVERAFLVGVADKGRVEAWTLEDSLQELAELTRSAGARVVGTMTQRLSNPSRTYIGKGKLEQLRQMARKGQFGTVICDDEMTPTQQRNVESALDGIKVIDRTALILDVFARRAHTHEGRLQVALAQHEYLLPRLAGQWSHLERLGAGIGTRGPGETQIETDRRIVRDRIQRIKKELESVRRNRKQQRSRRRESGLPVATMVGYTNAGKSTLMNALTSADVAVENKLFSTLDPVTRRIHLASGRGLLLTDTVGFIQKLPPTVVAAFRATLEEIQESDFLLHIVDITHPNAAAQADVVANVLADMNLANMPRILVLNKADLIGDGEYAQQSSQSNGAVTMQLSAVIISALRKTGLQELRAEMDNVLSEVGTHTFIDTWR